MNRETSSLLIKSNRVLGTRLVEAGLTTVEEMDAANEQFIRLAREKDVKRASLLRILIFDKQTLKEASLLDYMIEHCPVGAVMLENYKIDEVLLMQQPIEFMRASWTMPIDFVNDRWFVATAYYLSDPVRKFWEDRLSGRISWYVSTLNQFETVLNELEAKQASEVEAEPVKKDESGPEAKAGEKRSLLEE